MKIIESILTKNPCYTAGKKITVKGLMLHSVGCPQPKAQVFVKNWNDEDYDRACVHAFIDGKTGDVYQTLPWNHRGWHSGGHANNTHIGVEMCEPSTINYTGGSNFKCSDYEDAKYIVRKTYESAVELFAFLCKKYNLDPLEKGVIISHKEGHVLGVASNHGDPEHLWKGLNMGYTMDGFRKDVKEAMGKADQEEKKEAAKTESAKVPFTIKVDKVAKNDVLNIRKEPNANAAKTGSLKWNDPNVYTIIEVKNGWGLLKSKIGWINLYYTKTVTAKTTTAATSEYYPKYTGNSYGIDTVFKAIGVPASYCGSYKNRKPIAKANGIPNYTGSQNDNLKLITYAKQGKLKRP